MALGASAKRFEAALYTKHRIPYSASPRLLPGSTTRGAGRMRELRVVGGSVLLLVYPYSFRGERRPAGRAVKEESKGSLPSWRKNLRNALSALPLPSSLTHASRASSIRLRTQPLLSSLP